MSGFNQNVPMRSVFHARTLPTIAVLLALLFSGTMVSPALADAPAAGTVVEGMSVPGVALGDNRAQVEATWGAPTYCQNVSGIDQGSCEFAAQGGGQIFVRYSGPSGGEATASPDDLVIRITWHQAVSGWVTTAGINTTLALNDPDAVLAAYPNAVINQQSLFGWSIDDRALGIHVIYDTAYLTGETRVSMAITAPDNSPPPEPQYVHMEEIDLFAVKRTITAVVTVQDEQGQGVRDAHVEATWTYPDGSQIMTNGYTDASGAAEFNLYQAERGIFTFAINDVLVFRYEFDPDNSQLSATFKYKVR